MDISKQNIGNAGEYSAACRGDSPAPPPGLTLSRKRMRIINDKRPDTVYIENQKKHEGIRVWRTIG